MPRCVPPASDFPLHALLTWYQQNQRELPFRPRPRKDGRKGWKVKPNPYHVLVSEAMAQQTQIATVVPYFERFVSAFPTLQNLAAADEQEVLTLWQGLGYYRRARNLHATAQTIVRDFAGQVPKTPEQLLKLPGIGRYTAGAVASVAYNTPAPIVDGNVARVFARYFLIEDAVDKPKAQKQLWQLADDLVQASVSASGGGGPRDFNQGVMELGATVCTPKSAKCLYCPLSDSCAAHAAGRVAELPVKTPKKKPVEVTHTVLAVHRRGKYLFEQRPAEGLWSNMWQMPTTEDGGLAAATQTLEERFGLTALEPQALHTFTHQTTHRTIRFAVYRSEAAGRLRPHRGVWRRLDQLEDLPLAKPQQAAVESIDRHMADLNDCINNP